MELLKRDEKKTGRLVEESSTRESVLATKIADLQVELKHAKKAERNATTECDVHKAQLLALQKEFEKVNSRTEQFSHENRDLKMKETLMLEEYNQLEEENTGLQKSVSKLKHTLVEYEGLKVENKSFIDEIDSLQLQLQMTTDTREQYEKQLKDSFEAIKEHRERNMQLQKQIQELKHQSSVKSWEVEQAEIKYAAEEHPIVKQITEEYKETQPAAPGLVDDLMKELQFTELRDLEDQLRLVQEEKDSLLRQLKAKDRHIHKMKSSMGSPEAVISEARDLCSRMSNENSDPEEGDEYSLNNQLKELADLKEAATKAQDREGVYQMEIKQLSEEIDDLKELILDLENEKVGLLEKANRDQKVLADEVLMVKTKSRESDRTIQSLRDQLKAMTEKAGEAQGSINCVQDELIGVRHEISLLFQHISSHGGSKVAPNEILEKHRSPEVKASSDPDRGSPSHCYKMMTSIKDQLKELKRAVERASVSPVVSNGEVESLENGEQEDDSEALREQVQKLQELIATKREQISTLRTVLKANKSTYEVALANLKSRYENDKAVQTEANGQLKRQIKALKSECQTFASLRSMFSNRCEEYLTQLDEKQKKLLAAEEEKKTLNQLLKQAIHQKIALTQRLEEFELARERLRQFTRKGNKTGKGPTPTKPITRV